MTPQIVKSPTQGEVIPMYCGSTEIVTGIIAARERKQPRGAGGLRGRVRSVVESAVIHITIMWLTDR